MSALFFLFLSAALAVGWDGTRVAIYLGHTKGGRRDEYFLLALCWSPLAAALLALLLTLSGSNP
jgi:hypothetical protein